MLNTSRLFSLIQVWMTLKVIWKLELVQSFCCKVVWSNSNVGDGWVWRWLQRSPVSRVNMDHLNICSSCFKRAFTHSSFLSLQGSFLSQAVLGSPTLQSVGASSASLPTSSSSSSPSSSALLPGILAQNYTTWREEAGSVEEALFSLNTSLEDFRGQYNELQILEETVAALDAFVRVCRVVV